MVSKFKKKLFLPVNAVEYSKPSNILLSHTCRNNTRKGYKKLLVIEALQCLNTTSYTERFHNAFSAVLNL